MKMIAVEKPAYCWFRFMNQNTGKYCCSHDNRILTCNDDDKFPKNCPLGDA